jgi:hypothetical protein
MDAPPWTIKKTAKNAFVITIDFPYGSINSDTYYKCLLTFDRHHDNPKSNQGLAKAHLDEVKKLGTFCLDGGDLFCAMQGKYDRRSNKSDIREEHQNGEYLDSLVNTAADFFEPYAQIMPIFGLGNHETAILKNHETNLTDRLVHCLKERTGAKCYMGGYSTWVKFQFRFVNPEGKTCVRDSKTLWMFHGSGGDAPMSFGTLNVKRQGSIIPDADIIATGHSHNEFFVPLTRARLSKFGVPYIDEQIHIKVPTYKEEYQKGIQGWHVERGAPPKPQGATWLVFKPYIPEVNGEKAHAYKMYCDTERAK